MSILETNHEMLVDRLDLNKLLTLLYSWNVINKRQRDSISSKPASLDRNETLLEMLRRRSLRDYNVTINCLHGTNQSHIAQMLDHGGAVVRVHANLDGENITEIESEMSAMLANILIDRSIDQPNRILELVQHKVIAANRYVIRRSGGEDNEGKAENIPEGKEKDKTQG